jgi:hypothetical protein
MGWRHRGPQRRRGKLETLRDATRVDGDVATVGPSPGGGAGAHFPAIGIHCRRAAWSQHSGRRALLAAPPVMLQESMGWGCNTDFPSQFLGLESDVLDSDCGNYRRAEGSVHPNLDIIPSVCATRLSQGSSSWSGVTRTVHRFPEQVARFHSLEPGACRQQRRLIPVESRATQTPPFLSETHSHVGARKKLIHLNILIAVAVLWRMPEPSAGLV